VPTKEIKETRSFESVAAQGFQGVESSENTNVRKAGWLRSFAIDYQHRGVGKSYCVDVMAALTEGGVAE